ncbi:hypothetical protein [Pantoea vagans]|uniref:hypothetical protein n=1 Tax=Pantoea vagans TaxID=470934 RepID=UPI0023B07BA9|nr:hypothetical protein [Pantoea vagans]MDE8558889.1 hypothetical protein [Pantoea vagans]MDE8578894.1 hypothetical protein [Pantoea vagans]
MQAETVQHPVNIVQSHAEPVMQAEWTIPAPPACRAEFSLAPESIRAFTGQLPAVGGFVVLMALAIVIVRAGRRMIPERPDTMRIVHGSPSPAPFGSREMANLAAAEANSHYWQCMLAAFGGALEAEGFALRAGPRAKVPLPHAVRARVGVAIVKARSRYLNPRQSDNDTEAMLRDAEKDDYTGSWTDCCQRGAEAAGWYVVRRDTL